jgi:carnitine O-acetyltransferase
LLGSWKLWQFAMSKSRSFNSSSNLKAKAEALPQGYAVDPNAPPMLRFQDSLPRLPVPTLSSTGAKYLETVQPHLSPAAFAHTQHVVKSFVQSGQGHELQKRLQAHAADPSVRNWLSDWWNDAAYMGYRDPVVVFVSYYYVHLDDGSMQDQVRRTARLIKAMLPFREMVER